MGRKKKLSLEQEFNYVREDHKLHVVAVALMVFEPNGIYNSHPLLKIYKETGDEMNTSVDELGEFTANDLYKNHYKEFNDIYEICWLLMRDRLNDKKSYNLDYMKF